MNTNSKKLNGKVGRALAIRADNTDAGAVKLAVSETVNSFDGLDVLVNNAVIAIFKTAR